jgi:hypothetical protein
VCWKLWLARNEQIFNNIAWTPNMVAVKAKGLLLETLRSQAHKTDISLQQEEKNWLGNPMPTSRPQSIEKHYSETK